MKKHVSIVLVVVLMLCATVTHQVGYCQDSVKVTSTPSYYYFVGFSTITTTGRLGQAVMNNACKAKYGQGARMCTTQEILTSWQLPSAKNKVGWVNPSQIQLSAYPESTTNNKWVAIDAASGRVAHGENPTEASGMLNCNGWTFYVEQDTTGTVLDGQTGSVLTSYCKDAISVACCNR